MNTNGQQQARTTAAHAQPTEDFPSAIEAILSETKNGLTPRHQYDLLRTQIAPGCTDDELALFLYVAKQRGLDPFLRQIYAIKRRQWDPQTRSMVEKMTIQTGIDGYRLVAARTREHDGTDPVQWETDPLDVSATNPAGILCARVTVYRRGKPYTSEAWWSEYAQTTGKSEEDRKLSSMWAKMPRGQLAKCAEALALRKAFPEELGSIYTPEEMAQADNEPRAQAMPPQRSSAAEAVGVGAGLVDALAAKIEAAKDEIALKRIGKEIVDAKIADDARKVLRAEYAKRRNHLIKHAKAATPAQPFGGGGQAASPVVHDGEIVDPEDDDGARVPGEEG